jgi:hypothetical protein
MAMGRRAAAPVAAALLLSAYFNLFRSAVTAGRAHCPMIVLRVWLSDHGNEK